QRLRYGFDRQRYDDLIARLDDLTGPAVADVLDGASKYVEDRPGAIECATSSADHDGESAVTGCRDTTRNRRVQQREIARFGFCAKTLNRLRVRRGHIHDQRAVPSSGEDS